MKILVISSCTSKKLKRETPAGKLYIGGQHRHLMEGLEKVRNSFGEQAIDLAIISAKHGLLRECDVIEPYNCTFPKGTTKAGEKKIKERSNCLQIHKHTKVLISRYDLVFFLLSENYVRALQLAFDVSESVTQIFLLGSSYENLIPNSPNVYFVPCGKNLSHISKNWRILKGLVFKRLCKIVCCEGLEVFETVRQNPQQILDLVRSGES